MRLVTWCAAVVVAFPLLDAQPVRPRVPRGGGIPGTELAIIATDFKFEAPSQVDAGLVNVRLFNRGREPHHVLIVKVDRLARLTEISENLRDNIWQTWMHAYGGPESVEPGAVSSASMVLEPGRYVIACVVASPATHRQHFMDGMIADLEVVRGPRSDQSITLPTAEIEVRMNEWAFSPGGALHAGRRTIRVENDGKMEHQMAIVRLRPGKTMMQAAAWSENPVGPAPFEAVGGTTGLSPDRSVNVTVDLFPGEYAFLCTLYNPLSKKSHAAHGMLKAFTVVN